MKLGINYKITIIFVIVIAITLLGVFLYLDDSLTCRTLERIKTSLLKESKLSAFLLESFLSSDQAFYKLDDVADEIGMSLGTRVTIIGIDGIVYGDTDLDGKGLTEVENHADRTEVQEAIKRGFGISTRFSTTVQKNMLYVTALFGKDKPQGIVRLSIPLSEIDLISLRLKKILAVSVVFAFIFSIIASFFITKLISKPIRELSWAAKCIARGDFSKRSNVESKDEIGELARSINFMSDQIKLKIDEVTSNRSRLEAVLLSMFEGVIVVDKDGMILLINQAIKELLSIKEEPKGRSTIEIVRNLEVQSIVDVVLKRGKGVESREITILVPEEKTLVVHATAVRRGGEIEGAVLVFHDITELRRLENIRKDFIANVSHELRTPISNIKGYAETLLEGAIDDKEHAKEFVEIVHSDAERLAMLINDLLDLSKVESGKILPELKPVVVSILIKNILSKLDRLIKKKNISVELLTMDDLSKVLIDDNMISQVLLNLIDNAIKYTPEKGVITIGVRERDNFIEIYITDTGIGIGQEHIPRIFERFYRVDKARSRDLGGTGLGLSIVKHIVQAHKGDVFVESILGKGSTFSFTLLKA